MMHDPFLPFSLVLGIVLGNVVNGQAYPWNAQRMFAAKDEQTAYRSMLASAFLVSVLYMMPIAACAFVRVGFPNLKDPEYALAHAVLHWLPIGLKGLLLAVIFAVAQTTVDGIWNTTASMISHDVYRGILRPGASSAQILRVGKWSTLVIALFSFVVSLWFTRVLDGLYISVIFRLSLNFACWAGFLWFRANRIAAWISALVGVILGLYFKATIPGNNWITYMNLAGNGLLFTGGILGALFCKGSAEEEKEKIAFYDKVGAPVFGGRQYRKLKAKL
jgi:SSS family solute:Na+ symporter